MITEFSEFNSEDRPAKLNLTTLETRIVRGDLVQVFKIFTDYDDINSDTFERNLSQIGEYIL